MARAARPVNRSIERYVAGVAGGLIERLYSSLRGSQRAQFDRPLDAATVADSFAATVHDLQGANARGPFYPTGTRTPLGDLQAARVHSTDSVVDTEHLQALMGAPTRWRVDGAEDLDFVYLCRELTPMSSLGRGRREWLVEDSDRRISLDALLMNALDRTPIVAEIKVGNDENAELALVQALAAAAQLSTLAQRKRLGSEFRDYLGLEVPMRLDVYVITARVPDTGIRPQLAERAHRLADELDRSGALGEWVRKIRFLEATVQAGQMRHRLVH